MRRSPVITGLPGAFPGDRNTFPKDGSPVADPETAQEFTALYAEHHRRAYAYAVARAGQPEPSRSRSS
jgi:hypothetical protein